MFAIQFFTAGTLVETEAGQKPIEEIKVGDKVLAEDPETAEQGYFEVVALTNHPTDEILKVTLDAGDKGGDNEKEQLNTKANDQPAHVEAMEVTPEHPVYVEGKGWVWAENLVIGDRLRRSDGGWAKVLAVERVELDEPEVVYNFTVKGPHTYFVLEVGVLVHNDSGCGRTEDELRKAWEQFAGDDENLRILGKRFIPNGKHPDDVFGLDALESRLRDRAAYSDDIKITNAPSMIPKSGAKKIPLKDGLESLPDGVEWVPVYDILPIHDPTNKLYKEALPNLAAEGFDPNLAVELIQVDGKLILQQGHHRVAASWLLGYDVIPARILKDSASLKIEAVERLNYYVIEGGGPKRFFEEAERLWPNAPRFQQ